MRTAFVALLASAVVAQDSGSDLVSSRWFGGAGSDSAVSIASDGAGGLYMAGTTNSLDFPFTGGMERKKRSTAFLARFDKNDGLLWAISLGGSGNDLIGGVAVDAAGAAFVLGMTSSHDMPVKDALQAGHRGGYAGFDLFVVKATAAGEIAQSTFLGGEMDEIAGGIAVGADGDVYLTGSTDSPDFPVTGRAWQPALRGGLNSFVVRLDRGLHAIRWSTFLGGSGADAAHAIALDGDGDVHVAGEGTSADFPITEGAVQAQQRGGDLRRTDLFYAKLSGGDGRLLYATLLGGAGDEVGRGLATGPDGSAYLTGLTESKDFPVTATAALPALIGEAGGFAARIDAARGELVYATYVSGLDLDDARSIVVNEAGEAFVAGVTWSREFPAVAAVQAHRRGMSDLFLMWLDGAGERILASTLLGGSFDESLPSLALLEDGTLMLAGNTLSRDFPRANEGPQPEYGGGLRDSVLVRLRLVRQNTPR
jgi:hypothetical protein